MVKKVVLVFLILIILGNKSLFASSNRIITGGNTYDIVEPDAYEEIINKAKNIDMESYVKRAQKKITDLGKVSLGIPTAQETKKRYYVPKYTLDVDIPDGKGGILYPKGYTFNPLAYTKLNGGFIFFNANSATQIQWLKVSGYSKDLNIALLATEGDVLKASKILEVPVYKASPLMIERFNIKKVPSYVRQVGAQLEITEISISDIEKAIQQKRVK